jgi:hypothetical protein
MLVGFITTYPNKCGLPKQVFSEKDLINTYNEEL